MKKVICLLTSVLLVFLLSSCGNSEDSLSSSLRYSEEEMGIHSEDGYQGIFVHNEDGTYTPLAKGFDGYSGQTDKESPSRYIWILGESGLNTVPVLGKGAKLVLVYNTEDAMPRNFFLERYEFLGYSVGCHFYTAGGKIYLKTKKALSGSSAYNSLSYIDDESEYEVISINDRYPVSNIDNNIEVLLGLEYGKYYELSFYKGTKNMKVTLAADVAVLQSSTISCLEDPYQKTSKGYFTVNLPNLDDGYYYIAGLGMFYYEGDK